MQEPRPKKHKEKALFKKGVVQIDRWPPPEASPTLDRGAPTSTGGVADALKLRESLGIRFSLSLPRAMYHHGWGKDCEGAKMIRYRWYLIVPENNKRPSTISFDLVDGESPLAVGLDVKSMPTSVTCVKELP